MNENKPRILMVEDEKQVLDANCRMLRRRGYYVCTATSASEAYEQMEKQLPDLLILDIMLPDGNGLDICTWFRSRSLSPVLFLTGKSAVQDKVDGLRQGGDYYLTKPYSFDEFLAVIQRLLEREQALKNTRADSRWIIVGDLRLDLEKSRAYLGSEDTGMTRTEFSLLRTLIQNKGKILSAAQLYESVWGISPGTDTSTVRKHIFNLRSRIKADNTDDYDIISVYGKGYLFTGD